MTYPDDVMKAAESVAAYHPFTKHEIPELANNIARAIMAERQRCADLARSRVLRFVGLDRLMTDAEQAKAEEAAHIMGLIQRGDHV